MKKLAQLKLDAKRKWHWPWPIVHPNDERALLDGCYPDYEAAERVRRFYATFLKLPKPGGGTMPFHLLDWWYRDIIAPLFGWKRPDGRRRFDKGFCTTAKKSGKSTVLSGLPLYMICADGEEEAEAYACATDRDQASIIFQKTLRSARLSDLSKALRDIESKKQIRHEASGSWYEAISSDADSAQGKNPHLLLADELHVWRDREFFNALMYGDIMRAQPLFLMITTAGDDSESIGYEEYQYAKRLLDPADSLYSQSHFAFIAEAPTDVEWSDPAGWLSAQPSLRPERDKHRRKRDHDEPAHIRTIGDIEKLKSKCEEAKESPRKRREFIRYICNRWQLDSEDRWLNADVWNRCAGPARDHTGMPCWAGLDLASVKDIAALCLAFPVGDTIDLEWIFWAPPGSIKRLEHDWRAPVAQWVSDGWLRLCEGEAIEFNLIRYAISGVSPFSPGRSADCVASKYDLREVAYDPAMAEQLCKQELYNYDGITVVPFRQGFLSLNAPSKEFERRLINGKINHGGNPVASWMARNVVVDHDPAGNIKPNKKKSSLKIDGIVAAIMAVGRVVTDQGDSAYDTPTPMYAAEFMGVEDVGPLDPYADWEPEYA